MLHKTDDMFPKKLMKLDAFSKYKYVLKTITFKADLQQNSRYWISKLL